MEPYTSNSFDNSDYESQSLPYIPYSSSNEDNPQQYNAEIGTNSNAAAQSPSTLGRTPTYVPYNPPPNAVPQPATYSSVSATITQPRKKRHLWLYVLLTVLVMFVLAFSTYEVTAYVNRSTPTKTLDAFCSALQSADYQTAYDQFTPNMQTYFTESQFAAILATDSVAKCTHGSVSEGGTSVSTQLSLYHSKSLKTNNDIVVVSKDTHDQWKISGLQSA